MVSFKTNCGCGRRMDVSILMVLESSLITKHVLARLSHFSIFGLGSGVACMTRRYRDNDLFGFRG